jgi:transcriptional regulator GlxA family with amidase domain
LIAKKRVTTHWAYCAALSLAFPEARVEPEPIYVRDGKLWTSAGVTAGIDLALAMVEADLGRALSLLLARHLVMFVRRAGGQAQFSPRLVAQLDDASPLAAVLRYVGEHPERDLSVPVLAKLAGMSVRHFSRTFAREAGVPPARYVERVRIDEARRLLEDSRCSVEEVATRVGFTSADALRHALKSALSLSPRDYRARFGTQREE